MPFSLPPPEPWASRGWKVKIREKERVEEPHASIIHMTRTWRISLRTGGFLDASPVPGDVPAGVLLHVRSQLGVLAEEWDRRYPENPVACVEAEHD